MIKASPSSNDEERALEKATQIIQILDIDNISANAIANNTVDDLVYTVNKIVDSGEVSSTLGVAKEGKIMIDLEEQGFEDLSPEELSLIAQKIELYTEIQHELSTRIHELGNIIKKIKGKSTATKQRISQLQKLQKSLGLVQKKLQAFVKLQQEYEKKQALEKQAILRREKLHQLIKQQKKLQQKLKKALENAQKVGVVSKFLLPGKWLSQYKEAQKQKAISLSNKLEKIDKKIIKEEKIVKTLVTKKGTKKISAKLPEEKIKTKKVAPVKKKKTKAKAAKKSTVRKSNIIERLCKKTEAKEQGPTNTPPITPAESRQAKEQARDKAFAKSITPSKSKD